MRFAKVVNGSLEFAPRVIKRGDTAVFTDSAEEYAALGYKPIQLIEAPAQTGWSYKWEEDETHCKQVWVETECADGNVGDIDDMQSALELLGVVPEVDNA